MVTNYVLRGHSITINEPGDVYIYLSNEEGPASPVDVFFDDFKIMQTHSPVVQKGAERLEIIQWIILAKSQDAGRLPFGLSFNSYSRAAITEQNFKFNAGSEVEKMTDWYSTPFRKYDPSLGRFHGVDALASKYSSLTPSHFAANNPINLNDPTGLNLAPKAFDYLASDTDAVGSSLAGLDNGPGGTNDWARAGNIGRYGRGGSLYNMAYGGIGLNPIQQSIRNSQKMSQMLADAWQSTCNNCANTYYYDDGTLVGITSAMLLYKMSIPSTNNGSISRNQRTTVDTRGLGPGLRRMASKAAPPVTSGMESQMSAIILPPIVVEDTRLTEVTGGDGNDSWQTAMNGINAFTIGNGAKVELLKYAEKGGEFTAAASKYAKYAKGAGVGAAVITSAYTGYQAIDYYTNGGDNWEVGAKAALDIFMTGVSFAGPIGLGISATYFLIDASGGFGDFGQIKD